MVWALHQQVPKLRPMCVCCLILVRLLVPELYVLSLISILF